MNFWKQSIVIFSGWQLSGNSRKRFTQPTRTNWSFYNLSLSIFWKSILVYLYLDTFLYYLPQVWKNYRQNLRHGYALTVTPLEICFWAFSRNTILNFKIWLTVNRNGECSRIPHDPDSGLNVQSDKFSQVRNQWHTIFVNSISRRFWYCQKSEIQRVFLQCWFLDNWITTELLRQVKNR